MCVGVWRGQRTTWVSCTTSDPFETGSLIDVELHNYLDQLASEPQTSFYIHLPSQGITNAATMPSIFSVGLGHQTQVLTFVG